MAVEDVVHLTLGGALRLAKKKCVMLTVADVAKLSALTPWYVRQLINSGEIRAINVGGNDKRARWRIDPEDFNAWMKGRENRRRDLAA